jgi:hypothetical protein
MKLSKSGKTDSTNSGVVVPVLANIYNCITLHAKWKVDVQLRLLALVCNTGKIHAFGVLR